MELEDIRELFGLLKDTDISEFTMEKDGSKVRIKRDTRMSSFEIGSARIEAASLQAKPSQESSAAEPAQAAAAEDQAASLTITSPLVGTFYRSSSPDTEPFVEVGSEVRKGQVVCIIEAMKLMNEIESEHSGTIKRLLVENGNPVEYGEPLFIIEPD